VTLEFDAAVVGAGPGGSSAALELAAAGFSVVVFEKDVFPRHKVCGEFLSATGRDQLGRWGLLDELDGAGAESIVEGGFHLSDGKFRNFSLPEGATGISRFLLDTMLARRAARTGADVRYAHEVRGLDGNLSKGFTITTRSPGGDRRFSARVVISAWGRWSPLDIDFEREFASARTNRFFGWGQHFTGDSSHLAGRVHLYFFPGGYCGLSRVEKGIVNFAGIVSEAALRKIGGGWERFTARLRESHGPLSRHLAPLLPDGEIRGSQTVLFERHSPAFRDVLAVGDAAGVRDPFTGDGQASAMASGILAARNVAEFLRGDLAAADLAERYCALWTRHLKPRFGWDALFRRLILSPRLQRLALPLAGPLVSIGFPATRSRIRA
jgi:menaquinone-9 beta-reductase